MKCSSGTPEKALAIYAGFALLQVCALMVLKVKLFSREGLQTAAAQLRPSGLQSGLKDEPFSDGCGDREVLRALIVFGISKGRAGGCSLDTCWPERGENKPL